MLNKIHLISAWLLVALGLIHIGFTPFAYRQFTHNALWFVGAGLALVFAGFLNVAAARIAGQDKVVHRLCLIANASVFALFCVALSLLREPQVFVGLLLSAVAFVATIKQK
ncbi:MAG: hypothetical protein H0T45_05905 [Pyrinomonadaceae bacterium]|jgi:predicted neutral ceramidase superfamily lipid hydrolase|nr:hypothetical protein [Pyrinomonadaceae bacterium]